MKFNLILIGVVFLSFFVSCTKEKSSDVIQISNVPGDKIIDIKDYYSASELIPISLPDSIIIGNLFSSKAIGDLVYIHDNLNSCIFIVDIKKRSYVGKIKCQGEGPEEYLQLSSFDLDKDGNLYIYDFGRKILSFSQGKFDYEIVSKDLTARDFAKTKNGFVLVDPNASIFGQRNTIVEIDSSANFVKTHGGQPNSQSYIPVSFFKRLADKLFILDNSNGQIIGLDQNSGEYEMMKFEIEGESIPEIVDFWVLNDETLFTLSSAKNDSLMLFSEIDKGKFKENLTGIFSNFDFLPVNGFPYAELTAKYQYLVYNNEELSGLIDYYEYMPEAQSYRKEDGNYILKQDERFSISEEKVLEQLEILRKAKSSNSIVIRTFKN